MRYDFSISHVPDLRLIIADTLSKVPCRGPTEEESQFQGEVAALCEHCNAELPSLGWRTTTGTPRRGCHLLTGHPLLPYRMADTKKGSSIGRVVLTCGTRAQCS